ncbi:hypothetical protein JG688_00014567 [Phytophthora aleatoria]|uniref:Ankyrin repeat protein n=1 Tax=Phytophthora aleatoria TaxID=2496075 RepID=A0A8J5IH31_9STRA|nr:hypothetical protein JG688_00014567 [Phytophthora aleatoria]
MDAAARAGHLPVVKWLHFNRSEGCTAYAMHFPVVIGHLPLVQWLHSNRDEGCAKATMDWVARAGHLDVVKWLDANKLDKCSDDDSLNTRRADMFEMLLFLDAHCPQCIDRQFAEDTGKIILEYVLEDAHANRHELKRLEAKSTRMGIRDGLAWNDMLSLPNK